MAKAGRRARARVLAMARAAARRRLQQQQDAAAREAARRKSTIEELPADVLGGPCSSMSGSTARVPGSSATSGISPAGRRPSSRRAAATAGRAGTRTRPTCPTPHTTPTPRTRKGAWRGSTGSGWICPLDLSTSSLFSTAPRHGTGAAPRGGRRRRTRASRTRGPKGSMARARRTTWSLCRSLLGRGEGQCRNA